MDGKVIVISQHFPACLSASYHVVDLAPNFVPVIRRQMFQCQSIWVDRLWTKARFYSALFFRPRLAARPLRFTTLCRHQIVQGLPTPVVEHARHTKKEEVDRCLLPLSLCDFLLAALSAGSTSSFHSSRTVGSGSDSGQHFFCQLRYSELVGTNFHFFKTIPAWTSSFGSLSIPVG